MASSPIPISFTRQYANSLDQDSVFTTTAARTDYLTNPRRYGGQIVADLQEDAIYLLNAARTAWLPVVATGSGTIQTVTLLSSGGAAQTVAILAGVLINAIVVLPVGNVTLKMGTTGAGSDDIMVDTLINGSTGAYEVVGSTTYYKNAGNLYVGGITSDVTLKIYKR